MKNKIMRSLLAIVLVVAMLFAVAGCETSPVPSTPKPTVTPTPTQTPTPEQTETPTPKPTETPKPQADADEEKLEEYGVTFPKFDNLKFEDEVSFGLDLDLLNKYMEAYEIEIKATISGETHAGKSISSSKLTVDGNKSISWNNKNLNIYTDEDQLRFVVAGAGVYTVKYEIAIEHDKAGKYGFYAPGEVDEEFVIEKTYTVEKANLEIKTDSDAFRVEDKIFFAPTNVKNAELLKKITDGKYKTSVSITACDGTEVGEFALAITLLDDKGNPVDAEDILLDNYFVTVSAGTRYILSREDVAKVNAIRKMASLDAGSAYTTEYSIETIAYYNKLTDAQKQMASVVFQAGDEYYDGIIVENKPITPENIEKAMFNMERDGLVKPIEDAIKAYMTASTSTKKNSALKSLAEMLLNVDNAGHEYGSDLLYVLGALSEGFDVDKIKGGDVFTVVAKGATTNVDIVTFAVVYDTEDEVFSATFGYKLDDNESVVNEVYDEYAEDYITALEEGTDAFYDALETQEITQTQIDDILKKYETLKDAYDVLIPFQLELAPTRVMASGKVEMDIEFLQEVAVREVEKLLSRWDAYIELIETYGFDKTYINNADKDKLGATYMMMYSILGYSFDNKNLSSEFVQIDATEFADIADINKTALSNLLFANGEKYALPELFVKGALEAVEGKIAVALAVQDEVNALRVDLVQHLISTGKYSELYTNKAQGDYATLMNALLGDDLGDAYVVALAASLKDGSGEIAVKGLADIYAYIDAVVAREVLNPSSSFNKDLNKDGIDEALSELFEDLNKDVKKVIDDMAKALDEEVTD